MNLDVNLWIGLIGILSTLSMIVLGIIKLPGEKRKLDADAAKTFAEAAKTSEEAAALSAKRASESSLAFEKYKLTQDKKILILEEEINALKILIKEKEDKMEILQAQLDDVQDWAERLVFQIKALGADPVKIRKKK